MKALGLTAAIAVLAFPQSLWACPSIRSSSKMRNSPVVVEGVARCEVQRGRCWITVDKILKGSALLRDLDPELEVAVRPGISEDGIYCGIEWTPYDDDQHTGRVYLKRLEDGSFTAPFWPDWDRTEA